MAVEPLRGTGVPKNDVRPSEHTVDLHVQHHRQYQNTILVGNVPEDLQLMKTDFQRYKSFLSHKWVTSFSSNNNCIKPAQPYITAANFSIPRRLFFELGGFDEQLTDAEDYDLAMRAAKSNIPIYFNSEAVAWHDDFITCRSYIQRLRQYAIARKKLIDLKPAYYQERGVTTTSWKMNLFRMFAGKFWVDLIDSNRHTLLMPQFIRYKFYDIVTTGLGVYFTNKKF
jgi:GT2 family glycosyltransferase